MRIISGNYKGKKILEPKDRSTRPLKDLAKESIFNIIKHSNKINITLENSEVLDLFSGIGSFGLECLSRGSSSLTFVESYKEVLPILKKNILIKNINKIQFNKDEYCYHAGTTMSKNKIYAISGRVLNFVCVSRNFLEAKIKIMNLIKNLNWNDGYYRKDIGYKVINK